MNAKIKADLDTLQKMIEGVELANDGTGVENAMNRWVDEEFPRHPYPDRDEIHDFIKQILSPWMKASGELRDEKGKLLSFDPSELPQPDSDTWRKDFVSDLKKLRALIKLSARQ